MIIIKTWGEFARALDSPGDPVVKSILASHYERLAEWRDYDLANLARFIVIGASDSLRTIETDAGACFVSDGKFISALEYIERHGGWFEVCFIVSDDGYGVVLLIEDVPETDSALLIACRTAVTATEGASID